MASYIKPLKPADIHHIVTPFWNNAHDLHCFLEESEINKTAIIAQTVLYNFFFKFMFCVVFLFGGFYLDLTSKSGDSSPAFLECFRKS